MEMLITLNMADITYNVNTYPLILLKMNTVNKNTWNVAFINVISKFITSKVLISIVLVSLFWLSFKISLKLRIIMLNVVASGF